MLSERLRGAPGVEGGERIAQSGAGLVEAGPAGARVRVPGRQERRPSGPQAVFPDRLRRAPQASRQRKAHGRGHGLRRAHLLHREGHHQGVPRRADAQRMGPRSARHGQLRPSEGGGCGFGHGGHVGSHEGRLRHRGHHLRRQGLHPRHRVRPHPGEEGRDNLL